jgi:LmbE family N-acetylglucosaminyl deacetylase
VAWAACFVVLALLIAAAVPLVVSTTVAVATAWGGRLAAPTQHPVAADSTVAPAPPPPAEVLPAPTVTAAPPPPAPAAPPADPLYPVCEGAKTMSVWAHYDDDLLFVGSQISDAIAAGQCVRSVFLTAGDAGRGPDYSAGREHGIMRAYDVMRGAEPGEWVSFPATLATGAAVTVWHPADTDRISLVFFGLPDGNLYGQGYPASGEVSLAKLAADKIPALPTLSRSASLTWSQIKGSVTELIAGFAPTTFLTHVPGSAHAYAKGDHADHAITGVLTRGAWQDAAVPGGQIFYAIGYQSASWPVNVTGEVLDRKVAAFGAYAQDDPVIAGCRDRASCLAVPRFGAWLQRQYLKTEAELWQ